MEPPTADWRRRHIAIYERAKCELTTRGVTLSTADADPRQLARWSFVYLGGVAL
ncbi:MAG: hypothetical protein M3R48_02985 [Candidatus Dormibacteraeota bacterium]|nr:hypothetical protein [Candidatus Dormibacteraeota bacterium]